MKKLLLIIVPILIILVGFFWYFKNNFIKPEIVLTYDFTDLNSNQVNDLEEEGIISPDMTNEVLLGLIIEKYLSFKNTLVQSDNSQDSSLDFSKKRDVKIKNNEFDLLKESLLKATSIDTDKDGYNDIAEKVVLTDFQSQTSSTEFDQAYLKYKQEVETN